jgi:hypothetical protein
MSWFLDVQNKLPSALFSFAMIYEGCLWHVEQYLVHELRENSVLFLFELINARGIVDCRVWGLINAVGLKILMSLCMRSFVLLMD